jgi:hypothetical protein
VAFDQIPCRSGWPSGARGVFAVLEACPRAADAVTSTSPAAIAKERFFIQISAALAAKIAQPGFSGIGLRV